jgi:hypothetical protein
MPGDSIPRWRRGSGSRRWLGWFRQHSERERGGEEGRLFKEEGDMMVTHWRGEEGDVFGQNSW